MKKHVISATTALICQALLAGPVFSQQELFRKFGNEFDDQFGWSVNFAGDVNADGFDDFIVGSPGENGFGTLTGRADVFSGLDNSFLYTFEGDAAREEFGISVDGAGDVNGDGFDDLIVGAFLDDDAAQNAGRAFVFSGLDGSVLHTFAGDSVNEQLGFSVSEAGDVNGDGFDDVVVGAPGDDLAGPGSGTVRVFSGFDGSLLWHFSGLFPGDQMGYSVGGAGDVNGDGFPDFVGGAPREDFWGNDTGSISVHSGIDGSLIFRALGTSLDDFFGFAVNGAGDVNGDGFDDVIVGAIGDRPNGLYSGSAAVHSGPAGLRIRLYRGDDNETWFGSAVSGAGDVNGDGFADVIVGARKDDNSFVEAGSARVISGLDGAVLTTIDGAAAQDRLGLAVGGGGDVNGDGIPDLIAGAPFGEPAGLTDVGEVRVFTLVPPLLSLLISTQQRRVTLTATSLLPSQDAFLFASGRGRGTTPMPSLSVNIDLLSPQMLLSPLTTDALGVAAWEVPVPNRFLGSNIWFQAAQQGLKTNVTMKAMTR